MSVIIAISDPTTDSIFVGADSRVIDGFGGYFNLTNPNYGKVVSKPVGSTPLLCGSIGDLTLSQDLLTENIIKFDVIENDALSIAKVIKWAHDLRDALRNSGFLNVDSDERVMSMPNQCFFAYKNKAFIVHSDFAVEEMAPNGYMTLGSGGDVAKGSIEALKSANPNFHPFQILYNTLQIVGKVRVDVGEPYGFLCTNPEVLQQIISEVTKSTEEVKEVKEDTTND